jgi:hypothetical protein
MVLLNPELGGSMIKLKYRGFMMEFEEKNCLTAPLDVRVYAANGRYTGDTEGIKAAEEWIDTLLVFPERLADLEDFVEKEIKADRSVDPGEIYDAAERGHFELPRHLSKSGNPEVWAADDDGGSLQALGL